MKKLIILGASGSIGTNTLEIIRNHQDKFMLVGFSVYNNISKLETYLREFIGVKYVCVKDLKEVSEIIKKYPNITFIDDITKLASKPCDLVVNAIVGFAGLMPTISAIKAKNSIALANKESLVVAGSLVNRLAKENNVKIIPIDSEHSAILQCLESNNDVKKVIITCSGGPFLDWSKDKLERVKAIDALKHPNWKMGNKITIDSATLFNKAFEVIEAYHLFNLKKEQIEVVIHPQSIIHSMVEFKDGAIKAELGVSDMKIPISYAINDKKRLDSICKSLDFSELSSLTFKKADNIKPLGIAYTALDNVNNTFATILNAANEEAVYLFLNDKIKFLDIYKIVDDCLNFFKYKDLTIENILKEDKEVRDYVKRRYGNDSSI